MFKKTNLQAQTIIVIGFGVIAYMLFNLAISMYKDYQSNLLIKSYAEENARIAADNLKKKEEYNYVNSDQFVDKYAKENLNKFQDGEKVLIIPEKTENVFAETTKYENKEQKIERIILLPNRSQWKEYFFGDGRI